MLIASSFYQGCSSSGSSGSNKLQSGEYSYSLWNSDGKLVADGKLIVDSISSTKVTGTYKMSVLYDSTFTEGSRLKGGSFTGSYNSKANTVGFNMNPLVADDNVYFNGTYSKGTIDGQWTHSTLKGEASKGKFKATLQ